MKTKLHYVLSLWLSLWLTQASGQIQVTLTIPNLGSPYLSDYISRESNRVLILTNTTNQSRQIFLRGIIEQTSSPGYYLRTKETYRPIVPFVLAPMETKTLFASAPDWEFIDQGQLEDNLPDDVKRRIQISGLLPEGDYQICIRAYDFNTEAPASAEEPAGCQFFTSSLGTPPQLIGPECGAEIDQEYPLVTWAPAIVLHPMADLVYDLYVVELTSDALNPYEVMEQSILYRGGNPFVVENLRSTFYQFLPGDIPFKRNSKYAICIVGRSGRGSAFLENNGRSEICMVTMKGDLVDVHYPSPPPSIPNFNPDDFQLFPKNHLSGKLLYRFYGDGSSPSNTQIVNADNISPALEKIGQVNNYGTGLPEFISLQDPATPNSLPAIVVDNTMHAVNALPPFLLPPGYSTNGGLPLKQARIHFTSRLAVGKKQKIENPDDLEIIDASSATAFVTGTMIPYSIEVSTEDKIIASTKTDEEGNYSVSFYAAKDYGLLAEGIVHVTSGPKEFPVTIDGIGLYRLITMEVDEKWYCHPDVIMFLKAGSTLNVPDQIVDVQSYNLHVQVRSAKEGVQMAGKNLPIDNAVVRLGRQKNMYDQFPECFPRTEVKMEYYDGKIFQGNQYMADSSQVDGFGNVTFKRLVKHTPVNGCGQLFGISWGADGYYLDAFSDPFEGTQTYGWHGIYNLVPCQALLSSLCPDNECAPRTAKFVPAEVTYELVLTPTMPEMHVYSRIQKMDQGEEKLAHVMLHLRANKKGSLPGKEDYETDDEGRFIKEFSSLDVPKMIYYNDDEQSDEYLFIPYTYTLDFDKAGYNQASCNDCGLNKPEVAKDNPKELRFGERWKPKPIMDAKSYVKGIVEGEGGQAIEGEIRFGDSPFEDLKVTYELIPGSESSEVNASDLGNAVQGEISSGVSPSSKTAKKKFKKLGQPEPFFGNPPNDIPVQNSSQAPVTTPPNPSGFSFKAVSRFSQPAPSGFNVKVIIQPDADNLFFPGEFAVTIPAGHDAPGYDLGKFVLKERMHRPIIRVMTLKPVGINGDNDLDIQPVPVEDAEIILSNFQPRKTNENGEVAYKFGSPAYEFSIRITKEGFVPIVTSFYNDPSPEPIVVTYLLIKGKSLSGFVTRADNGQPIEGARIYTKIVSDEYGSFAVETFSDAAGAYVMNGLPNETLNVTATKSDENITFKGLTKPASAAQEKLDFQLTEAPFVLSHIWNLPVSLESVNNGGPPWTISGAFVDLPANARFQPLDESQHIEFKDIALKTTGQNAPNGKPIVEPQGTEIESRTLRFRSVLNDAHLVEMSGPKKPSGQKYKYKEGFDDVSIDFIKIVKGNDNNGQVRSRVFTLLEYFRFQYNYSGQFYLGETTGDVVITPFKGTADKNMPEKYFVLGYNYLGNTVTDPHFNIAGFEAYTDRMESYVHEDTFSLATKMIIDPELSNPDKIIVSTGRTIVLPDKLLINPGNEKVEFDLEKWHVKLNSMTFDESVGGYVAAGSLMTDLLEFPFQQMKIKPQELELPPVDQLGLDHLTLGGILKLDINPGAQLLFDYQKSIPDYPPNVGHWRVQLVPPQGGEWAAQVDPNDFPGWTNNSSLHLKSVLDYSDGNVAPQIADDQHVHHYNVIDQKVTEITFAENMIKLHGLIDMDIPNMGGGSSSDFKYYKEQGQTKLLIQGLYPHFETYGNVEFFGNTDYMHLSMGHFDCLGNLYIKDDKTDNEITLRAKLIKDLNSGTRIEIIKVASQGSDAEGQVQQTISFGEDQTNYMSVIQGKQEVSAQTWEELSYQVSFEGFEESMKSNENTLWFKVTGDVISDLSKKDEIGLNNISTPFGSFSIKYLFAEKALVGDLEIAIDIPMGAVTVLHGTTINMRMGELGFYLVSNLFGKYPLIDDVYTNFIVGSYPFIPPSVQQMLLKDMHIHKLPDFLIQNGIHGLYISASKPILDKIDVHADLLLVDINVYLDYGLQLRFWMDFGGQSNKLHLDGIFYGDFEFSVNVVEVCTACVALDVELQLGGDFTWTDSHHYAFDVEACGSIDINYTICVLDPLPCICIDESLMAYLHWTSDAPKNPDYALSLGETCNGGDASSSSGQCNHHD